METYAESTPTAHSSRLRSSKEKAAAKGVQRVNLAKEWSQSILDISGCGLTSLPPQLTELTSLEELILRDNKLTSLPDLSALTNLKVCGDSTIHVLMGSRREDSDPQQLALGEYTCHRIYCAII
jgi:hypothetical protein